MSIYNKLINNLDNLKLTAMSQNLNTVLDRVNQKEMDMTTGLYELTQYQLDEKQSKEIAWCIQWGAFPFKKTFEDFDFSFQPSINKEQILDFQTMRFLERQENILFIGSPGVGKTHLAIAIGIMAAKQKKQARYINCNDLLLQLKRAHLEGTLENKISHYSKYKILIIDEVGYMPLDSDSAHLLFQIINKRYEKNSTIITTNTPLTKWGEMFSNPVLANAILDRLVHHSHIINITGRSYRLKDKLTDIEANQVK